MTVQNWKMERYLLGELSKSEMAALNALESENNEFHSQLEQLKNSNEELLAKYSAKEAAEKMHSNLRKFALIKPKSRLMIPLSACAALLLTATAMLAVFSSDIPGENNPAKTVIAMNEDGTRVKGLKTDLEIWRKTADSTEKLSNNNVAKAGDLLQIRYTVPEQCYGVLLSLDGSGVLTIHLSGKGKALKLEAGKTVSLDKAYELDNAPKFETFYLFTDNKEFALAPIAENLLEGKKLPKDLQVAKVTLLKK